jgi:hypothetical protein
MADYLLIILSLLLLLPTVLPILSVDWWWVRIWDFPRLQMAVLYVIIMALILALVDHAWTRWSVAGVLAVCVV